MKSILDYRMYNLVSDSFNKDKPKSLNKKVSNNAFDQGLILIPIKYNNHVGNKKATLKQNNKLRYTLIVIVSFGVICFINS